MGRSARTYGRPSFNLSPEDGFSSTSTSLPSRLIRDKPSSYYTSDDETERKGFDNLYYLHEEDYGRQPPPVSSSTLPPRRGGILDLDDVYVQVHKTDGDRPPPSTRQLPSQLSHQEAGHMESSTHLPQRSRAYDDSASHDPQRFDGKDNLTFVASEDDERVSHSLYSIFSCQILQPRLHKIL